MTGFSTVRLKVASSDGRNFVLLEPFTYTARSGEVITVPVGAESDGASTPKSIWMSLPPFGLYWPAAYLHDYLYRCTDRPKNECDGLLSEAMQVLGVNETERILIYEGVHYGGESSFTADRKAAQEKAP